MHNGCHMRRDASFSMSNNSNDTAEARMQAIKPSASKQQKAQHIKGRAWQCSAQSAQTKRSMPAVKAGAEHLFFLQRCPPCPKPPLGQRQSSKKQPGRNPQCPALKTQCKRARMTQQSKQHHRAGARHTPPNQRQQNKRAAMRALFERHASPGQTTAN